MVARNNEGLCTDGNGAQTPEELITLRRHGWSLEQQFYTDEVIFVPRWNGSFGEAGCSQAIPSKFQGLGITLRMRSIRNRSSSPAAMTKKFMPCSTRADTGVHAFVVSLRDTLRGWCAHITNGLTTSTVNF